MDAFGIAGGGKSGKIINSALTFVKKYYIIKKTIKEGERLSNLSERTELGKACIFYRAKHRLTQAELGERCGVTYVTICRVEQGAVPSATTEAKIRLVIEEDE